jgi:hypothetical protein
MDIFFFPFEFWLLRNRWMIEKKARFFPEKDVDFLVQQLDGTRSLNGRNRPERPIFDGGSAKFLAHGTRTQQPGANKIANDVSGLPLLFAEIVACCDACTAGTKSCEKALRENCATRTGGRGVQVAKGARAKAAPVTKAEKSSLEIRAATARVELPDGVDFVAAAPVPLIKTADTRKSNFRDQTSHFFFF